MKAFLSFGMKKFISEFEINCSPKMLYQYITEPSNLAQWFADDVNFDNDKNLKLTIDGEELRAKIISTKLNECFKIEYLDEEGSQCEDPEYTKFTIERNDFTQSTYLIIEEKSEMYDTDLEHQELWQELVDALKDVIGA